MSIEINSLFGNITNSIYSTTGLNNLFVSIIWTSVILSIIIIIILMFMYPAKKGTPAWILFKIFLYIVAINTIILSVHNSIISNNYKEKYLDKSSDQFISNINKSGGYKLNNDHIKVNPSFDQKEYTYEIKNEKDLTSVNDILNDIEQRI